MATHEQTYLGPILERLEREGLLTLADDTNPYEVVALLARYAADATIVIDADGACPECERDRVSEPVTTTVTVNPTPEPDQDP